MKSLNINSTTLQKTLELDSKQIDDKKTIDNQQQYHHTDDDCVSIFTHYIDSKNSFETISGLFKQLSNLFTLKADKYNYKIEISRLDNMQEFNKEEHIDLKNMVINKKLNQEYIFVNIDIRFREISNVGTKINLKPKDIDQSDDVKNLLKIIQKQPTKTNSVISELIKLNLDKNEDLKEAYIQRMINQKILDNIANNIKNLESEVLLSEINKLLYELKRLSIKCQDLENKVILNETNKKNQLFQKLIENISTEQSESDQNIALSEVQAELSKNVGKDLENCNEIMKDLNLQIQELTIENKQHRLAEELQINIQEFMLSKFSSVHKQSENKDRENVWLRHNLNDMKFQFERSNSCSHYVFKYYSCLSRELKGFKKNFVKLFHDRFLTDFQVYVDTKWSEVVAAGRCDETLRDPSFFASLALPALKHSLNDWFEQSLDKQLNLDIEVFEMQHDKLLISDLLINENRSLSKKCNDLMKHSSFEGLKQENEILKNQLKFYVENFKQKSSEEKSNRNVQNSQKNLEFFSQMLLRERQSLLSQIHMYNEINKQCFKRISDLQSDNTNLVRAINEIESILISINVSMDGITTQEFSEAHDKLSIDEKVKSDNKLNFNNKKQMDDRKLTSLKVGHEKSKIPKSSVSISISRTCSINFEHKSTHNLQRIESNSEIITVDITNIEKFRNALMNIRVLVGSSNEMQDTNTNDMRYSFETQHTSFTNYNFQLQNLVTDQSTYCQNILVDNANGINIDSLYQKYEKELLKQQQFIGNQDTLLSLITKRYNACVSTINQFVSRENSIVRSIQSLNTDQYEHVEQILSLEKDIDYKDKYIADLNQKIMNLNSENRVLRDKFTLYYKEKEFIEQTHTANNDTSTSFLINLTNKISWLENSKEKLSIQSKHTSDENLNIKNKINHQKQMMRNNEIRYNTLYKQQNDMYVKQQEQMAQLREDTIDDYYNKMNNNQSSLNIQDVRKNYEQQIKDLCKRIEFMSIKYQKHIDVDLVSKYRNLLEERNDLQTRLIHIQGENKKQEKDLEQINQHIALMTSNTSEIQTQLEDLRNECAQSVESVADKDTQDIDSKFAENLKLLIIEKDKNTQMKREYQYLMTEQTHLQEMQVDRWSIIVHLNGDLVHLQTELNYMKEFNSNFELEDLTTSKEFDDHTVSTKKLNEWKATTKAKLDLLNDEIKNLQTHNNSLKTQLDQSRSAQNKLNVTINTLNSQNAIMQLGQQSLNGHSSANLKEGLNPVSPVVQRSQIKGNDYSTEDISQNLTKCETNPDPLAQDSKFQESLLHDQPSQSQISNYEDPDASKANLAINDVNNLDAIAPNITNPKFTPIESRLGNPSTQSKFLQSQTKTLTPEESLAHINNSIRKNMSNFRTIKNQEVYLKYDDNFDDNVRNKVQHKSPQRNKEDTYSLFKEASIFPQSQDRHDSENSNLIQMDDGQKTITGFLQYQDKPVLNTKSNSDMRTRTPFSMNKKYFNSIRKEQSIKTNVLYSAAKSILKTE